MTRFRDRLAEQWLRAKSSGLLRRLQAQWSDQTSETVASGLEQGLNPRSVGVELAGRVNPLTGKREGGSITLGEREEQTVREFKRCLVELDDGYFEFELRDRRHDNPVRRAIREGVGLPQEKVTLLVNRFEAKVLKQQADLIAQTEMLAAMNRSEWLSIKSAFETGDTPAEAVSRIWDSCGDAKVRPSHKALAGQSVGLNECFVSPITGAKMMYPGDTSLGASDDEVEGCRCRVRHEVDWCYQLRKEEAERKTTL